MKKAKLDKGEKEILTAYEREELKPTKNPAQEMKKLRDHARSTLQKDNRDKNGRLGEAKPNIHKLNELGNTMQYRRAHIPGGTFFFTVVTHQRKKILCLDENVALMGRLLDSVQERHPFKIEAWVLLSDHLHCLWTLPPGDTDYSTRWMLIKSRFTRECTDLSRSPLSASRERKREQYVWQRRFWEHQIRDEGDFSAHVEYIHYNPVKHGLVASPKDWAHSSFQRYVGEGLYDAKWGAQGEVVIESTVGRE